MEIPIFQDVTNERPQRNAFDLSHQVLLTCGMGDLIPTMCQEVVPGDKFRIRSEIFARAMALKHPIMQKVDIFAHYFFVPNRLCWNANNQNDSWQCFITGGRDGKQEPVPPYFSYYDLKSKGILTSGSTPSQDSSLFRGGLLDFLGYPVFDSTSADQTGEFNPYFSSGQLSKEKMLAYPIIAYNLIYDNFYRDQNLETPVFRNEEVLSGGSIVESSWINNVDPMLPGGANATVANWRRLTGLKKRAWRKDYFTSALPWAQRGEPVTLPIGISAPVSFVPPLVNSSFMSGDLSMPGTSTLPEGGSYNIFATGDPVNGSSAPTSSVQQVGISGSSYTGRDVLHATIPYTQLYDAIQTGTMTADLSESTSISINQLRASIKIQEWLERNATGGARYVEQIYAHFGVVVPDATMQRPIYLGGGKQVFQISEVMQTTPTDNSPLGSYAGNAYSLGDHVGFDGYQFNEHGWIMCIMSIIPKASYFQGLNRKFSRFDKFDYYFPEFAHLGEQEVLKKELYFPFGIDSYVDESNNTFGYQSRYAEYRYNNDEIHGDFRVSLIDWHLGRKFDRPSSVDEFPSLTREFVQVQPEETTRIFAYTADDADNKPLMVQIWHDIQAIRPMPVFAQPYI